MALKRLRGERRLTMREEGAFRYCNFDKGGSPPAAPPPTNPADVINADANANRYNVTTPFGTRTWSRTGGGQALGYEDWLKQNYPGGAPTSAAAGGSGGYFSNDENGGSTWHPGGSDGGGGAVDLTGAYNQYTTDFAKNNPQGWELTETMSPDQRRLYEGRNDIVNALLGRADKGLDGMGVGYKFNGATDPTTNRFFNQQKKLLDGVFERDEGRLDQKLANQGLPMGSQAYKGEFKDFRGAKNDAYEKAAADALDMGFRHSLTTRQQNLNEIAQALGGAQLTPFQAPGSPVDVNSAYNTYEAGRNRGYQGDIAAYNAGVSGQNSMMGGLFGLGGAAMMSPAGTFAAFSDRRLKRDIVRVGELTPGIGWYAYRYVWDGLESPVRHGVMADEVERVMPEAILTDPFGFLMVDYGRVLHGRTVN